MLKYIPVLSCQGKYIEKFSQYLNEVNFTNIQALKDFGIGAGMLYQSTRIPWYTRGFELPAYTTLDNVPYYSVAQTKLQLALNINNITIITIGWVLRIN